MASFHNLDKQFRLTPWSDLRHSEFVKGQYAVLCASDEAKAKSYLESYRNKEKQIKAAHEQQKQFLKDQAEAMLVQAPKDEAPEYIDWEPKLTVAPTPKPAKPQATPSPKPPKPPKAPKPPKPAKPASPKK